MESICGYSKLEIPNDPRHVRTGAKYVAEISKMIGFEEIEAKSIEQGVYEVGRAVISFFFAGILPFAFDTGDALMLQYLNNVPVDYDAIQLDSEMSRGILRHIKHLDPNVVK